MVLRIDPEPLSDPAQIAWLGPHLRFAGTVRAWIPEGYERYARLLHPAREWYQADGEILAHIVRWRELSAWSGKPLHRTSWSDDLVLRADGTNWQSGGRSRPMEGELPEPDSDRLVDLLGEAAPTPQALWLLVWNGYDGGAQGVAMEVSRSLTKSGRTYLLFRGSLESGARDHKDPPFPQAPSFWWPEDRAWFVSTDIDSTSTYVGGSSELIDRLLADDGLEGFPAALDDPINGSPNW
jgi:hypothetical protein